MTALAFSLALLLATPAADDPWADVSTWASYWHVSQPTRIEPAKPVPLAFSDLSAIRETATAMADDLAWLGTLGTPGKPGERRALGTDAFGGVTHCLCTVP